MLEVEGKEEEKKDNQVQEKAAQQSVNHNP
jgi:hypothetical protein